MKSSNAAVSRSGWLIGIGLLILALASFAVAQSEAAPPPPPPPDMGMGMQGPGPGMGMHVGGGNVLFHDELEGGKVVTGVPLSADLVVTRDTTLADGNRIHTEDQTRIYRDSQGRVRREVGFELVTPSTGATKRQMIVITDPVAGKRYVLNPKTKVAHEMPLHPFKGMGKGKMGPGPGGPGGPWHDGANFSREQLGTKTINGVQAEGTRMTHTIPAGRIGNEKPIEVTGERWFSNELQLPVMTTHSDPMMGVVTTKLSNVNRSEPDAALFQVPADYKIKAGKPGQPMFMPSKP